MKTVYRILTYLSSLLSVAKSHRVQTTHKHSSQVPKDDLAKALTETCLLDLGMRNPFEGFSSMMCDVSKLLSFAAGCAAYSPCTPLAAEGLYSLAWLLAEPCMLCCADPLNLKEPLGSRPVGCNKAGCCC